MSQLSLDLGGPPQIDTCPHCGGRLKYERPLWIGLTWRCDWWTCLDCKTKFEHQSKDGVLAHFDTSRIGGAA